MRRIELGVGGERAHVIQLAVEVVLAARFERDRIELVGQRLLAERQHASPANGYTLTLTGGSSMMPPRSWSPEKARAEAAIEEAAGRFLFHQLSGFGRSDW